MVPTHTLIVVGTNCELGTKKCLYIYFRELLEELLIIITITNGYNFCVQTATVFVRGYYNRDLKSLSKSHFCKYDY